MRLPIPLLKLMVFAINKYGRDKLSRKIGVDLPDFSAITTQAINGKRESRRTKYSLKNGIHSNKVGKYEKIGKSEIWKFDSGVGILKPLGFFEKIGQFINQILKALVNPIRDFANNLINNLPPYIVWLYVLFSAILGIVFSVIDTIFRIIISIGTLSPSNILKTIIFSILNLIFVILLQIVIALLSPVFVAVFGMFVNTFSGAEWFRCMILGIVRRESSEEQLVVISSTDISSVENVTLKGLFGRKTHGAVILEGDTEKRGFLDLFAAFIVPEYWRGTSHVFKTKNAEEAASLAAFLKGTFVVNQS